jgi:gamma-polyglutamate biosynthesis protein CapA
MNRSTRLFYVLIFALPLFISSVVVLSAIVSRFDLAPFSIFSLPQEKLYFTGDVMLGRHVETLMDTYGSAYPYARIQEFTNQDIVIGNFEATIPKQHVHTPDFTFQFSVDGAHLGALSGAGFDYMSLANNHSYDHGSSAFLHTRSELKKHGIIAFGDQTLSSEHSYTVVKVNGIDVALVGIYAVDAQPTQEHIVTLMQEASEHSDAQFAYVHWGMEYESIHTHSQEQLAQILVDAGADLVIGHHPHVVQDIGLYKEVPIFYSLGNYIFDQYFSPEVMDGLVLEVLLDQEEISIQLKPVTTADVKAQPRSMTSQERNEFLKTLARRSEQTLQQAIIEGEIRVIR